jgi:hypothetical protein
MPQNGENDSMLGFRINRRERRVPANLVARFHDLPTANVSDVMARMAGSGARLRPMHGGGVLVGQDAPRRQSHGP